MMRSIAALISVFAFQAAAQDLPISETGDAPASAAGAPQLEVMPPSSGYVITPWGTILFPAALPPTGDTSTLSGPGPSVSTGPEVGSGPEVSTGPVVGDGQ
jgi:hypothetical protein